MKPKLKHNNGGFTLVELLVVIVAASLVMFAASSVLLLGLRVHRRTLDTAQRRENVQIILTLVENLASGGEIRRKDEHTLEWVDSSKVAPLLTLDDNGNIVSGSVVMLENAILDVPEPKDGILTIIITMDENRNQKADPDEEVYQTSVYQRPLG